MKRIVGGLEEDVVRCLLGVGGEKVVAAAAAAAATKVGNAEVENGTTVCHARGASVYRGY